jgi:hypothetical protein
MALKHPWSLFACRYHAFASIGEKPPSAECISTIVDDVPASRCSGSSATSRLPKNTIKIASGTYLLLARAPVLLLVVAIGQLCILV